MGAATPRCTRRPATPSTWRCKARRVGCGVGGSAATAAPEQRGKQFTARRSGQDNGRPTPYKTALDRLLWRLSSCLRTFVLVAFAPSPLFGLWRSRDPTACRVTQARSMRERAGMVLMAAFSQETGNTCACPPPGQRSAEFQLKFRTDGLTCQVIRAPTHPPSPSSPTSCASCIETVLYCQHGSRGQYLAFRAARAPRKASR